MQNKIVNNLKKRINIINLKISRGFMLYITVLDTYVCVMCEYMANLILRYLLQIKD